MSDFDNLLKKANASKSFMDELCSLTDELIKDIGTKASQVNTYITTNGALLIKALSGTTDPERREALIQEYKEQLQPLTDSLAVALEDVEELLGEPFMGVRIPSVFNKEEQTLSIGEGSKTDLAVDARMKTVGDFAEKYQHKIKESVDKDAFNLDKIHEQVRNLFR